MQEEAILIGISQLGAVFAGFISIFMVFAQANGKFSATDSVRARVIIHSSFAVVLASMLPFVLHGVGAPPAWIWRLAAGLYLALGCIISVDVIMRLRALDKTAQRKKQISRALSLILNAIMIVVGVLILAGLGQGGLYVLLLVLNLTLASLSFISFATDRLL